MTESDRAVLLTLKDEFENHVKEYNLYRSEEEDKHRQQLEMHTKNMEAIAALTKSTQDVVDDWVFANNFSKFIKWVSTFAVLGAVIKWVAETFK